MHTLYIIKAGSTFPAIRARHQDFEDWIATGLIPPEVLPAERPLLRVINATRSDHGPLSYPEPQACAGVVVSGSHAMVTEAAAWMQDLQQWLHQVCMAGVPVLGICFGHQLLAQTLGGQVGAHPAGLELGTVPISIQTDVTQDPLWHSMPTCFEAHAVHYQSVRRLPEGACVIAGNSHEAHHAFRWRNHVWGVQFHPEFSRAAMQAYIDHIRQQLAGQTDAAALPLHQWRCSETPEAAQLLRQFALHAHRLAKHKSKSPWLQAA